MTSLAATPRRRAGRAHAGRITMTWITWRQHRMALTGAAILLGAFAVVLGVSGLRMQSAHDDLTRAHCSFAHVNVSSRCGLLWGSYYHAGYPLTGNIDVLAVALAIIPIIVGVFIGAPMLAREFETGTAKFAWTQAVGRGRWVAAKVGLLGAALAAAGAAFGALAGWWLLLADGTIGNSRWQGQQFGLTTVTFTGWIVVMFAAGVFAGALIRRTVPAMAATAVTGAVLLWFSVEKFTGMLTSVSPLHTYTSLVPATLAGADTGALIGGNAAAAPHGGWVLNAWFTGPRGQIVPVYANSLNPLWNLKPAAQVSWLASHHLTPWVSYQSAGRFWTFQAVEGGAAVLIALLLAAATVWLVRRQAARPPSRHRATPGMPSWRHAEIRDHGRAGQRQGHPEHDARPGP